MSIVTIEVLLSSPASSEVGWGRGVCRMARRVERVCLGNPWSPEAPVCERLSGPGAFALDDAPAFEGLDPVTELADGRGQGLPLAEGQHVGVDL
jgi:hypothetical protein